MQLQLETEIIAWPLSGTFRIARGARDVAMTLRVRVMAPDGATGLGESVPYARYGETPESARAAVEAVRPAVEAGLEIAALQTLMPAGAARNALDCALWDLRAKQASQPVWALAGLPPPKPVLSAYTISLDTPAAMAAAAAAAAGMPLLKVKIGAADGLACVAAVADARPDARLIVDANEALVPDALAPLLEAARGWRVELVEQPFPVGQDRTLRRLAAPVAVCADESFHVAADVETVLQGYDAVNVKLDKAGGFTAALEAIRAARAAGLKTMMGCMVGSSLALAPAQLLAGLCDWADLDGPLLLARDHAPALGWNGAVVDPPMADLWG